MSEQIVEAGFNPREKKFELESLPGGWVRLRRLSHGESNELTDHRLSFEATDDGEGKARVSTKEGRHFSFAKAIVDHNLGVKGTKFDFKKEADVDALDPVVGDEVSQLIESHNESLEASGDLPNSGTS